MVFLMISPNSLPLAPINLPSLFYTCHISYALCQLPRKKIHWSHTSGDLRNHTEDSGCQGRETSLPTSWDSATLSSLYLTMLSSKAYKPTTWPSLPCTTPWKVHPSPQSCCFSPGLLGFNISSTTSHP